MHLNHIFLVSKLRIFNFARNFHFNKFEDAENMTILFQTHGLKYPNKVFLARSFCLFVCFAQFFAVWQILEYRFQISQSFYSILSLKIRNRTFLVSNLRIFIFARNFFKLSTQNYTNKAFLVPKLKLFVLRDLPFHKFEGTDSNYKNFFKDFSLKISRK